MGGGVALSKHSEPYNAHSFAIDWLLLNKTIASKFQDPAKFAFFLANYTLLLYVNISLLNNRITESRHKIRPNQVQNVYTTVYVLNRNMM